MALGAAHDRVDARHQFVLVEGLRHVVVGAEAEALDLVLDAGEAGEDEDRRVDLEWTASGNSNGSCVSRCMPMSMKRGEPRDGFQG
jgi:hypothetical protein